MNPKISIIVPIYNVEPYLRRCIESILNQTFEDFELILVNDGSPDNCGQICQEYALKDKRVKLIHQENSGVSKARNNGISISRGQYIQFIDSDDYVEPQFLEKSYYLIKKHNADMVFTGIIYENEYGELSRVFFQDRDTVYEGGENILNAILSLTDSDIFGFTHCKMIKSSILKENKIYFNDELCLAEDEKWTCDCCLYAEKIVILKESYYRYMQYGTSRKTLRSANINDFKNLNIIFNSWVNLTKLSCENIEFKNYLSKKAYGFLYEEAYNIIFSSQKLKCKHNQLELIKSSNIYHYLKEEKNSLKQKILILLINSKSVFIFRIFNKINYILGSRKKGEII